MPSSQRTLGMANGQAQRLGRGKHLVAPHSWCVWGLLPGVVTCRLGSQTLSLQGTFWRWGGA